MVTLKNIADEVHLDISTVSKVLHRPDVRFNVETRARILQTAERLGYRQNRLARALAQGKTHMIGVVGHSSKAVRNAEHMQILTDELHDIGYKMILASRQAGDIQKEREHIEDFLSRRVDGLIIFNDSFCDISYYKKLQTSGIPLVFCGVFIDPEDLPAVWADSVPGMYDATKHLLDLGHRDIAYPVGKDAFIQPRPHRVRGFQQAMEEAGAPIRPGWCMEEVASVNCDKVQEITRNLLRADRRPTAIIYNDDEAALVGLHTILEMGLRVPDDVSIVGFGDLPLAKLTWPELTTVQQKVSEFGVAVMNLLMRQIEGNLDKSTRHIVLRPHLVVRRSTGPVAR